MESLAEAGLSALANLGGLNPIKRPRKAKRLRVAITKQINVDFLCDICCKNGSLSDEQILQDDENMTDKNFKIVSLRLN